MSAPSLKDSTALKGRVVVVGNSDFVSDRFASRATSNVIFALNAIDWLAQDEALIAIRSRDRRPPPLVFASPVAREGIKYANLIFLPTLIATLGAFRMLGRRRKGQLAYQPRTAAAPGTA
jgi:ABC-type uncharacterized transport system involved in gliding motility auxiliary subunit